jgi:hypothetical protein
MSEPQSNLDLELLAAQLRRHTDDLSLYGAMLLNVLAAALPADLVEVRHESGLRARLHRRSPAVLGLRISLGPRLYDLERADVGARPTTRIGHQSGGVVLSSQLVDVRAWCADLARDLVSVAAADGSALAALQRLTEP